MARHFHTAIAQTGQMFLLAPFLNAIFMLARDNRDEENPKRDSTPKELRNLEEEP